MAHVALKLLDGSEDVVRGWSTRRRRGGLVLEGWDLVVDCVNDRNDVSDHGCHGGEIKLVGWHALDREVEFHHLVLDNLVAVRVTHVLEGGLNVFASGELDGVAMMLTGKAL